MTQSKLKIPDQLFCGLIPNIRSKHLPVCLMTPFGTDKSAKNRIDNVARSVKITGHRAEYPSLGTQVIENKPLIGFKLTGRFYGGSSHDNWYIEDPRGFDVEVTSANIAKLITTGLIENGEFLFPCIWARDGSANVLISTDSKEYQIAISNTAASKGKASWKDVKIGDTVLLRNNIQGRWMGKMYLILSHGYSTNHGFLSANEHGVSDKPYHIIYVSNDINSNHSIHIIATPQLSKIVDTDPITREEAEKLVNEYIQDPSCSEVSNLYRRVMAASIDKVESHQFEILKEVITADTECELKELIGPSHSSISSAVFIQTNNVFGKLKYSVSPRSTLNKFYIIEYSLPCIDKGELRRVLKEDYNNYRRQKYYSENHVDYTVNLNDKLYNLQLRIKTKLGNDINLPIS